MGTFPRLELIVMFNKYLDDNYPVVSVMGYEYYASEALEALDLKQYEFEFEKWKKDCEVEEE